MFENLLNLVRENAGDAIIKNPVIPNERNDEAISYASNSIVDGLKGAIANGNINDVLSMFTGGNAAASPVAQNINGGFIQNLMDKFGLDNGQAGGVANNLLPSILNQFVHKTNDPNDSSFDIQNIMQNLTGGNSGLDIQNIISQFQVGSHAGGNGLMDTVKGLFK
ncbi:hypothetical protein BH10BAC2_BH10BAC2_14250 [soil metagenome]